MRKIILSLVLALSVAGCNLSGALQSVSLVTASYTNPVTPDMLNNAENGAIIVFSALKVYKQTCIAGTIPASCRQVIASVQVYTRRLPQALRDLRVFVRNNDQVNAVTAYNTLIQIMSDFKSVASANNIPVGAI